MKTPDRLIPLKSLKDFLYELETHDSPQENQNPQYKSLTEEQEQEAILQQSHNKPVPKAK